MDLTKGFDFSLAAGVEKWYARELVGQPIENALDLQHENHLLLYLSYRNKF